MVVADKSASGGHIMMVTKVDDANKKIYLLDEMSKNRNENGYNLKVHSDGYWCFSYTNSSGTNLNMHLFGY